MLLDMPRWVGNQRGMEEVGRRVELEGEERMGLRLGCEMKK